MTGNHPRGDLGPAGPAGAGDQDSWCGLEGLQEGTVPYPWPYDGALAGARLALVVAGANRSWADRCADQAPARAAIDQSAAMVRRYGTRVVFLRHTSPVVRVARSRGSHDSDDDGLSSLHHQHHQRRRGDELAVRPAPADAVVDAAGVDGFFGSSLDALLRRWGCTHLALAGFGLEGPVHSTLRSANDRGYECLLLADACAALGQQTRRGALSTVTMSGGIFGAVGTSAHLAALLETAPAAHLRTFASADRTGTEMKADPIADPTVDPTADAVPDLPARETRAETAVAGTAGTVGTAGTETGGRAFGAVGAEPYPWPHDGSIDPEHTAVVNIDWQRDFCGPGGYLDAMGYDLSLTRAGLGPTSAVLAAVRSLGFHVLHTREGHRPDLSDCPPNKLWRSQRIGAGIGDPGPAGSAGRILVQGEPGWEIVPEVAPLPDEPVIDKPGKGAFYATDLDLVLRSAGVTHLVLTGITTDVCVHSTLREATDRGYECLLLSDCTGATDPDNYEAAVAMVAMQGGVFGSVATSAAFLTALGWAETPGTPDLPSTRRKNWTGAHLS